MKFLCEIVFKGVVYYSRILARKQLILDQL